MLETREEDLPVAFVEEILDFHDRGDRVARQAEELEADRAHMRRHAVQDEARRGDDAVGALLLRARQPGEELVGDILAQALFAKPGALYFDQFFVDELFSVRRKKSQSEFRTCTVVDLAEILLEALDLELLGLRCYHVPRA